MAFPSLIHSLSKDPVGTGMNTLGYPCAGPVEPIR